MPSSALLRRSPSPGLAALDASMLEITRTTSPKTIPNWEDLVFGKTFTDHMLTIRWTQANGWEAPRIHEYGPLAIDPASTVLQYSATLFEGMKAYKDRNGRARLFRPDMNFARLNNGAARMSFPWVDPDQFLDLIRQLVSIDEDWIPTGPGCSLYIRPTMIGNRASLGVGPSDEILLYVIMSPVGPYYSSGHKPISLLASEREVRAWPGGTGNVKFGANYCGAVLPQVDATRRGYSQVLWLFGPHDMVTEVGMMNFFVAFRREDGTVELTTPPLGDDLILPGVTRDCVLQIARAHANAETPYQFEGLPAHLVVTERQIYMEEIVAQSASGTLLEVFGTGTAAVVSAVSRIGYKDQEIYLPCYSEGDGAKEGQGMGPIASAMLREITGRQRGDIDSDWSVLV